MEEVLLTTKTSYRVGRHLADVYEIRGQVYRMGAVLNFRSSKRGAGRKDQSLYIQIWIFANEFSGANCK